ncbi:RES family NAD+ phosphorylase [Cypionkella aquatica]|uniref:RES family NAD+ phosphorylase n=1 Tax=Cypionkella aquatica TaxID=1756042 RepID=UPI0024E14351|nr:RES family NAD+ phosphorylase [Cypionkella aquatica]
MPEPSCAYKGPLYRALNPIWARDPLSGEGAKRHGGRFNAKGRAALYTAMSVMGAVAEANQIGRPFEPVTLVSYTADLTDIFDATNLAHLAARGIALADLAADDWRLQMHSRGTSRAQDIAESLIAAGYHGLIVPSYAKGTAPDARNLVLWHWPNLTLIDSELRLK